MTKSGQKQESTVTMGRPAHEPTAALRRRVAIGKASGMSDEQIAMALNIARGTLLKHYMHDLTVGAEEKRIEVREAMFRQAKKGNVAAARLFDKMSAPVPTENSLEIVSMPSQATGVKAQRNEQAKTAQAGTEWQRLLPSSVQ